MRVVRTARSTALTIPHTRGYSMEFSALLHCCTASGRGGPHEMARISPFVTLKHSANASSSVLKLVGLSSPPNV